MYSIITFHFFSPPPIVNLPKTPIPALGQSSHSWRPMQSPYRLPHPLPPLPVRKGVRGRRPKSQTIAMLKEAAEAAAAAAATSQNGQTQSNTTKSPMSSLLTPKPYKKRGPKPGSKVQLLFCGRMGQLIGLTGDFLFFILMIFTVKFLKG